jgi:hypothetical protein
MQISRIHNPDHATLQLFIFYQRAISRSMMNESKCAYSPGCRKMIANGDAGAVGVVIEILGHSI